MTALFSYRNYVDDEDCVLTNADIPVDGYPVDNLKLRGLGDYAAFGFLVDVIVEFSEARTFHIVAMLGGGSPRVNLKQVRVQIEPVGGGFTDVVDIEVLDETRILGETGQAVVFPDGLTLAVGERLRVTCWWFDSPSLIANPRAGRLWIGPAMFAQIQGDWVLGFRDSGVLDGTDGQNFVEQLGVRTRTLNLALAGPPRTLDMYGFEDGDTEVAVDRQCLQGMQMMAGLTGEVIVIPRIDNPLWVHRTIVYGHIESPYGIGHAAGPFWKGNFTVVEER
jgi:hypothetical protein